jgi:hypothetical protein
MMIGGNQTRTVPNKKAIGKMAFLLKDIVTILTRLKLNLRGIQGLYGNASVYVAVKTIRCVVVDTTYVYREVIGTRPQVRDVYLSTSCRHIIITHAVDAYLVNLIACVIPVGSDVKSHCTGIIVGTVARRIVVRRIRKGIVARTDIIVSTVMARDKKRQYSCKQQTALHGGPDYFFHTEWI